MSNLTSLDNIKRYLRISSEVTSDDALLNSLNSSYSKYVQSIINRNILSATYTENFNGFGGNMYFPPNYPITAVSSLTIDGANIPLSTNGSAGYLFTHSFIGLKGGYVFTPGIVNVTLTYTAGYEQTPEDLEQAVIELIGLRYREMERIGLKSKVLAGEQVNYMVDALPDSVKLLLKNYKRVF